MIPHILDSIFITKNYYCDLLISTGKTNSRSSTTEGCRINSHLYSTKSYPWKNNQVHNSKKINEIKHTLACSSQMITISPQKDENREITDYS